MLGSQLSRAAQYRLYHINRDIILAGVLSSLLVALFIHITRSWTEWIGVIVGLTAVLDAVLDATIFFLLHYRSTQNGTLPLEKTHFIKDCVRIQGHRIFLSPLYYLLAMSFQTGLLFLGMERSLTVIVAYILALVLTRTTHTIYGLKTGLFE